MGISGILGHLAAPHPTATVSAHTICKNHRDGYCHTTISIIAMIASLAQFSNTGLRMYVRASLEET